ncbi:MAG: hypothetical protein DMF66_12275 [Acidobacteria bacterium]|nr:MAG: hypothetical protein DMF66_12275 [Acidobacteriota bacterium]
MRLSNLRRLLADRRRARRARVRRSVEVLAGVTLEGEGRESLLFTHTLDISETGMSVLVQRLAFDRFAEGEGRESLLFTHTLDIGETGMSVLVQRLAFDRFAVGEGREIKIALALPEGRITVLATPVHVRPGEEGEERGYVVGLRIVEAGEEERARLRDFLRGLRRGQDRCFNTSMTEFDVAHQLPTSSPY